MKLLMFCGAVALITCASSSVDGDILLEMREEFAQMKAEMKAENAQMKAEISELKVQRNARDDRRRTKILCRWANRVP
jgi:hypothetical protein